MYRQAYDKLFIILFLLYPGIYTLFVYPPPPPNWSFHYEIMKIKVYRRGDRLHSRINFRVQKTVYIPKYAKPL